MATVTLNMKLLFDTLILLTLTIMIQVKNF